MTGSEEKTKILQWVVWPARDRPHTAAAVVAMILGTSWYAQASFGLPALAVVALVVLGGAVAPFLFPTTYRLDADGVEVSGFLHRRRKPWKELACFVRGEDVVAVSTCADPTERTIRQGFLLRLAGNGDEVAAYLEKHLPEWKPPRGEPGTK